MEEAYCGNSILKQCLEEKEQELGILKNVITQDKALLKEVDVKNNILQQQQKLARWWNKVHSSGIREVDIVYQATQTTAMQMHCPDNLCYLHPLKMTVLKKSKWHL